MLLNKLKLLWDPSIDFENISVMFGLFIKIITRLLKMLVKPIKVD